MFAVMVAWTNKRILTTPDLTKALEFAKIQTMRVYVMDLWKVELVFKNWEGSYVSRESKFTS